ncbi:MAG: hypothetical protein KAH30_06610 [Caldisericia bacterium]|nr:hypothetical protein [Caldisericia bacterium]
MPYLWGFLFFLFLLGFPFFILVVANKQDGWLKIVGWILSGVFVLILIIASLFSLVRCPGMMNNCPGFQSQRMNHHDFDRRDDFGFDRDFRPSSYKCNPADCLADPKIREYFFERVEKYPEFKRFRDIEGFGEDHEGFPHPPKPELYPNNPDLRPPPPESKPNP